MKKRTITVFNCDHCNKLYQRERACKIHERDCGKNPANNRACYDCHNLRKIKQTILEDNWQGYEEERIVEAFYCEAKRIALYPPKIENRNDGRFYDFGSYSNEPMQKQCEKHSSNDVLIPHNKIDENPFID